MRKLHGFQDFETTQNNPQKSWRQDNNHYYGIINRFHITALPNPHCKADRLMYIFVFSRILLSYSLHLNCFPEVSIVVLSGFSYFHSLVLVRKLAVLIVVCLSAISCTLHCGVNVLVGENASSSCYVQIRLCLQIEVLNACWSCLFLLLCTEVSVALDVVLEHFLQFWTGLWADKLD